MFVTAFCFFLLTFSTCSSSLSCGYDACPSTSQDRLNVHIVPHTHDDVGWLKTVDQYYYGIRNGEQRAGVQYILDSVIQQLKYHPNRRFMWVETAFFWMWWKRQDEDTRQTVRGLVDEGRLELVSGSWSMNDEACVHYNSVIDSFSWGHRRLADAFNRSSCSFPRIGWQIDPFGHSREQASLLSQSYFDGVFFTRVDYEDQGIRNKEKRNEFVWKGSDDLGPSSHLFTGILAHHYNYPDGGFCLDDMCNDSPIVDDVESEEYNKDKVVDRFIQEMGGYQERFQTNNVMVTMGDDFWYQNALVTFKHVDDLIKYVNEKNGTNGMTVFYSTPSCYLKSLHSSNKTWTTKTDDFFPYATDKNSFVVGYFSSRPATKLHERKASSLLQPCKQLQVMADLTDQESHMKVNSLKEAVGVMQHHDAITGTEKQHVANDYARIMDKGEVKCRNLMGQALGKLVRKDESQPVPVITFCPALNVSECPATESKDKIAILIYNPLAKDIKERISIPWSNDAFSLKDAEGKEMQADLIVLPEHIKKMAGRFGNTTHEISFETKLPPLGFATVFLERKKGQTDKDHIRAEKDVPKDYLLEGKGFQLLFQDSGKIKGVKLSSSGKIVDLSQSFRYYKAAGGSSAYVFRPDSSESYAIEESFSAKVIEGKLVTEVHQIFSPWMTQIIRVSPDSRFIDFDWVVGPVEDKDDVSREIIVKFDSSLKNNKTFYTDANGRQIMKRIIDHRETWKYNRTEEPVSGNYYPVVTRMFLRDEKEKLQMTLFNDRGQGGSSLAEGSLELMIHRRLLHDGVAGEPLNELGYNNTAGLVVRGKHRLLIDSIEESEKVHPEASVDMFLTPQLAFMEYDKNYPYRSHHSGMKPLPPNIHLLTLEQWTQPNSILVRLEHVYSSNVKGDLSSGVKVPLKDLFPFIGLQSAVEMTMSGNQPLTRASRLEWKTIDSDEKSGAGYLPSLNQTDFTLELKPMEIRTLMLTVSR